VWLALGDSTMEGTGNTTGLPAGYPPPSEHDVWMSQGDMTLRPLSEPTSNGVLGGVGPAGLFVWRRWQETGNDTAIVNAALGSQRSDQWLPSEDPNSPYQKAVVRLRQVLEDNPTATFGGFILSDGYNNAIQLSYSTWLADWATTMTALRAEFGNKPLIYTRLPDAVPSSGELGYPMPGHDVVRDDQIAFQSPDNIMVVTPDGNFITNQTGVHKNTAGTIELAELLVNSVP
jgi:hypothetical protein